MVAAGGAMGTAAAANTDTNRVHAARAAGRRGRRQRLESGKSQAYCRALAEERTARVLL